MPAPSGNQFWKVRSSHGRDPIFATPNQLWEACAEYFEWVELNPLYEARPFAYQGDVKVEKIAKMRAMTISGLCIFLDIARVTWAEYAKREGFSYIASQVEEIIRTQKFEGAAADLLNPNIIARELGLADKSELTGKDGAPLVPILNVTVSGA
ncbi:DNA-packaging protein [Aminobacter anthyllidis]|uniref:DNA-packaging protein n=1 Tax=Aminobacter anthyllidis TaxID=1035067 RepID=A0A9X1D3H3_9HYPH|nr:DNA-packaging protein [Aminobacter anthyllidis]MBT1155745.1 DNA-packaging protein [Aminobacter anthyllidis]